MLPWQYSEADLLESAAYYPNNTLEEVRATYEAFNYSSYYVPCIALLVIYCLFVGLILADGGISLLPRGVTPLWLRAHIIEAPMATKKHHVAAGKGWATVRLPLRLQSLVIAGLFLANFVPLFGFYRRGQPDVFYELAWKAHLRSLADRTAIMATGLLPLVIVTATRRALPSVSGIDFGNAMLYHRWLARFCGVHALIHSVAWTVDQSIEGLLAEAYADPYWNWGCASTAMFIALIFLSIRQLRVKAYEIFIALHVVMAILAMVTLYFHVHLLDYAAWNYFLWVVEISAGLWALDRLVRWINKGYLSAGSSFSQPLTQAIVSAHGSDVYRMRIHLGASKVVPLLGASSGSTPALHEFRLSPVSKLRAGTSVRLTIPRLQFWSDHPFTVVDAGHVDGQGYVDLLIRSADGLTKHLARLVEASARDGIESMSEVSRSINVVLEGPYGKWHPNIGRHDDVLLFAGGIGITFCLPYFIHAAAADATTETRRCKLVWAIRDFDVVDAIADQLVRLDDALRASAHKGPRPIIELCVTAGEVRETKDEEVGHVMAAIVELNDAAGVEADAASKASSSSSTPATTPAATKSEFIEKKKISSFEERVASLADRLATTIDLRATQGRPSKRLASHFEAQRSKCTAAVVACGPASLCDDVREGALYALRTGDWADVEYIEECFDW